MNIVFFVVAEIVSDITTRTKNVKTYTRTTHKTQNNEQNGPHQKPRVEHRRPRRVSRSYLVEDTRHATHIYSQYVLDTTFHRHLRTEYLSLN